MTALIDRGNASARMNAVFAHGRHMVEQALASGVYLVDFWLPAPARQAEVLHLQQRQAELLRPCPGIGMPAWLQRLAELEAIRVRLDQIPRELVWSDQVHNLWPDEGARAVLTHALKGATYTASNVAGLIEDTGWSAVANGNTAASITAAGSGSPANGWNEAPSSTCATRATPSFGTAASRALATSSNLSFSTLASDTIKGLFMLIRSAAGTAPTTAVGNTNGAILSCGTFTGGDQPVTGSGTLTSSYSAGL